jgi:hypothetical protein
MVRVSSWNARRSTVIVSCAYCQYDMAASVPSRGEHHGAIVSPGPADGLGIERIACIRDRRRRCWCEPSEAEVEADKALATKVAVGFLTGLASLAGAEGVVASAAFAPVAEAIATWAVRRLGRRRVDHVAETVMDGAGTAGIPLKEFIDRGVADDRRHELFARTLTIAQDTALRNKRRALGRALAAGVMGDDARIDEELLFIRAVADIDECTSASSPA